MERTKFVQKRYAGCPICHHRMRDTIEGSILQGTPPIVIGDGYDLSQRDINKHLHHMRDKLVAEVAKDAEIVLDRMIKAMAKKYEEQD